MAHDLAELVLEVAAAAVVDGLDLLLAGQLGRRKGRDPDVLEEGRAGPLEDGARVRLLPQRREARGAAAGDGERLRRGGGGRGRSGSSSIVRLAIAASSARAESGRARKAAASRGGTRARRPSAWSAPPSDGSARSIARSVSGRCRAPRARSPRRTRRGSPGASSAAARVAATAPTLSAQRGERTTSSCSARSGRGSSRSRARARSSCSATSSSVSSTPSPSWPARSAEATAAAAAYSAPRAARTCDQRGGTACWANAYRARRTLRSRHQSGRNTEVQRPSSAVACASAVGSSSAGNFPVQWRVASRARPAPRARRRPPAAPSRGGATARSARRGARRLAAGEPLDTARPGAEAEDVVEGSPVALGHARRRERNPEVLDLGERRRDARGDALRRALLVQDGGAEQAKGMAREDAVRLELADGLDEGLDRLEVCDPLGVRRERLRLGPGQGGHVPPRLDGAVERCPERDPRHRGCRAHRALERLERRELSPERLEQCRAALAPAGGLRRGLGEEPLVGDLEDPG